MRLEPLTEIELGTQLAKASRERTPVECVDLSHFNRIVEHCPEDLTATVQSGMRLDTLQHALGERGQWVPLDPALPETLTVLDVLNHDLNGPRRFGFGKARDYVLGLRVALADGSLIRTGGKVVKNVAGYDLGKLFIGAGGALGIIVEATFKLLPRPRAELFFGKNCASVDELSSVLASLRSSSLRPSIIDCWRGGPSLTSGNGMMVVLGFSGTEAEVAWQAHHAAALGFSKPSDLSYDRDFWISRSRLMTRRVSVVPTGLAAAIAGLASMPFLARAGNGVLYTAEIRDPGHEPPSTRLETRAKMAFDPNHILPSLPPLL